MYRLLLLLLLLPSCYRASRQIEPQLPTPCHPREIARETRLPCPIPEAFSVSPFAPLSCDEMGSEWGREYHIGLCFAQDFDLYRAITAFKRALFLLPPQGEGRRAEIEYATTLAYYLGKKYVEVIHTVEATTLARCEGNFPAIKDLLVILYDSYHKLGREKEKNYTLKLIENFDPCQAEKLCLLMTLERADFPQLEEYAKKKASVEELLSCYHLQAKSVKKAELLNALLPGAGYYYLGQKQTALTAFLVNTLFIGAAVAFFENDNIAAGIITLSLESGWYFGGIYGAGLAAKYHNEKVYGECVCRLAERERLFPLMLLKYSF